MFEMMRDYCGFLEVVVRTKKSLLHAVDLVDRGFVESRSSAVLRRSRPIKLEDSQTLLTLGVASSQGFLNSGLMSTFSPCTSACFRSLRPTQSVRALRYAGLSCRPFAIKMSVSIDSHRPCGRWERKRNTHHHAQH